MPFEQQRETGRRIAVIGGGISGLGAAYHLARTHRVTLFEAEPRLGGHARTVLAGKRGDQPVDTGFIVFNYANYPHLTRLFDDLNVPVAKSDMSFGVSLRGGKFEYGLASLDALFAQRSNLARPKYWRMLMDLMRFNRDGLALAHSDQTLTIRGLLTQLGTSDWFRDRYLLPFSGAIWSTPTAKILDFPAYALMQFFDNHALLSASGQHQWYTVQGGSRAYVSRLEAALVQRGVALRTHAPVQSVTRGPRGAAVKTAHSDAETFDEVIFATHSDDTLAMLADADAYETATLGAIKYQPNDIVLHADERMMPKRRKVWSSWVYTEDSTQQSDRIDLTYWMNSLQPIPKDDPHFVTLNSKRDIREDLIYDQVTLRHPVYDEAALAAQISARETNGRRSTWFCGAWMRNGFHEDGLASGIDVAERILQAPAQGIAAQ